MPNPSELERMAQEKTDEMSDVSGTLTRNGFARMVLLDNIAALEAELARSAEREQQYYEAYERAKADGATGRERIASLKASLADLEAKANG